MPIPFVPAPDSPAVAKLRSVLKSSHGPLKVGVNTRGGVEKLNCYVNVRNKIEQEGHGKMLLGWAVWQTGHYFIEGEAHAVFDHGDGRPLVDCTPHKMPDQQSCREILFIPDDSRTYDFNTTDIVDNVRVPLIDDSRIAEALDLFSQRVALLNCVPALGAMPPDVSRQAYELQARASALLNEVVAAGRSIYSSPAVGRNDPCPCQSGKKYKKCHGSVSGA
jgi:hypothetical protein